MKEIAKRQRHSIKTAMESYKAINLDCNEATPVFPLHITPPVKIPAPKPRTDYFNPAVYAKQYRDKNKEQLQEKRTKLYKDDPSKILRAKLIWNLNKGLVSTPRKASIEKYGLKYETDHWI